MPRSSPSARAAGHSDRTSLYQEITAKIIAELEAGRLPWVPERVNDFGTAGFGI